MMNIVSRSVSLLGLLFTLLLVGCSQKPGMPPISPQPTPAPPSTVVPGTVVSKVTFQSSGKHLEAQLGVTENSVYLVLSSGHQQVLENPVGSTGHASLQVLTTKNGDHLLVTISDERLTWAWILVPSEAGLSLAYHAKVDDAVSIEGQSLKVSSRRYKDGGGYELKSQLFRYDDVTGKYQAVTD